jgi:serine/threonine-protein kinase
VAGVPGVTYPGIAPLELPPDALTLKAREYAASFGYTAKPADWARAYAYDRDALRYIETNLPAASRWQAIERGHPNAIYFWYRQSPRLLEPIGQDVTTSDPPETISGMIRVTLDTRGRLAGFTAVPPQVDDPEPPGMAVDWKILLTAAGFDPAAVVSTASRWTPPVMADSRAAWSAKRGDTEVRIEAAAWRGKPVYFAIVEPWTRPSRMQAFQQTTANKVTQIIVLTLAIALLIGAALLSRHNLKRGRGDSAGATRLGVASAIMIMIIWVLTGWHVPSAWEVGALFYHLAFALLIAGSLWVAYVAIEPYIRRHWPQAIIGWTRLIAGGFRDPLVGRDLLIGAGVGCFWTLVWMGSIHIEKAYGEVPSSTAFLFPLLGARHTAALPLLGFTNTIINVLAAFFVLFIVRVLLRREWLAAVAFIGLTSLSSAANSKAPLIDVGLTAVVSTTVYLLITRAGFLAFMAAYYVQYMTIFTPFTSDISGWAGGSTLYALLVVAAITAWAVYATLRGTSLIKDDLL